MLFLVIFLASCNYKSDLPKEVPSNLRIIYIDKTDNRKYFQRIEIKNDDVTIKYDDNKKTPNTLSLKLTKKQKTWLYRGFVEEEFDLINYEQSDKPESDNYREISLETNGVAKTVRYDDSFPLSQKDRKKFNALWTDINDFEVSCCPSKK